MALAVIGEIEAAEDVSQEAFVHAIEKIDDCRDPSRFGAWLRQIVRSHARNHIRYMQVRRTEPLSDELATAAAGSPSDLAERADMARHLLAALRSLTEERREVVLLHDLEGWTHREIAARMGIPEGTVRSHLHLARKDLRKQLGPLREDLT